MIVGVQLKSRLQLLGVVHAHHASGLRLCSRQSGEEETRQDGNDRDDDQEFYEGETTGAHNQRLRITGPQRKPQRRSGAFLTADRFAS